MQVESKTVRSLSLEKNPLLFLTVWQPFLGVHALDTTDSRPHGREVVLRAGAGRHCTYRHICMKTVGEIKGNASKSLINTSLD
jgi:hypothetical protein